MKPNLLLALLSLGLVATWVQSKKPNIVYILTDDQGYADVSWADNPTIPTPNLDQLRRDGTELMQFYTHQKCTASRAALLTGRYAHSLAVHTNDVFSRYRNYTLDPTVRMMPYFLKKKGYKSHIAGKWHLGYCAKASTPTMKGFDTFYGSFSGTDNHFTQMTKGYYDWNYHHDGKFDTYWETNNTHNTNLITDRTVKLLDEHFNDAETKDKPIFIYVSYLAPHIPTMAPAECMQHPMCQAIPESDVRRTYCGMVKCMDDGVGEIVEALKRNNVFDDTIIVYHSDNGGTMKGGASSWPLRGSKTTLYEGGTKSRALIHAPKLLRKAPKRYDGLIHITDMMPTLLRPARMRKLPDNLDGMDMWKEIKKNKPSKREWMIYNINSVDMMHAIRFRNSSHDFKLLFDNETYCPGWQRDPRPKEERTDGRKKYVKCPEDGFRLFNMKTNFIELEPKYFPDAALEHPEVLKMMKDKLEEFKTLEAPIPAFTSLPKDGPGRPQNNNGAFGVGDCEYNTKIAKRKMRAMKNSS